MEAADPGRLPDAPMNRTPRADTEPDDHEGPDESLVRIGDFARLAGTNLRTLRYYEERGLIEPASRSQGGFRYYRRTDVNRVRMVQSLQDLGLSLERIGELMDTRDEELDREERLSRVRRALVEQDELLSARVRSIEEERSRIHAALHKLGDCESCRLHPTARNNYCEPCPVDRRPLPHDLSALF